MKKITYLFIAISIVFASCTKEEGCTDSRATNYKSSAESDDGSCVFSIAGGEWITQSISASGTMSVSLMGIPFLDSAINYIETDSLEPYKLSFFDDNTYVEYDQSNQERRGGTWSVSGTELTINTPDTTLIGTLEDVSKTNATIIMDFSENFTEDGATFDINLTQTLSLSRDW